MKNQLISTIDGLARQAGAEGKGLLEIIVKENKTKKYSINPIVVEIVEGNIVTNASDLAERAEELRIYTEELKKKGSLSDLEEHVKLVASITTWIKNNRINTTKKFDDVKSGFTKVEKELQAIQDKTKKAMDLLGL